MPPVNVRDKFKPAETYIDRIRTVLGHNDFNIYFNSIDSRIYEKSKVDHFTYARKDQTFKRFIMKAVPGIKSEDLMDEIKYKIRIAPFEIVEMKTRYPQLESQSYLSSLTTAINNH